MFLVGLVSLVILEVLEPPPVVLLNPWHWWGAQVMKSFISN